MPKIIKDIFFRDIMYILIAEGKELDKVKVRNQLRRKKKNRERGEEIVRKWRRKETDIGEGKRQTV